MLKVNLVSLGCPKNLVDSEVILGILTKTLKARLVPQPSEADVIIVNTCSFVQDAKEESVNTLLELANYKTNGKCKLLICVGCLAQRHEKELKEEMPEVDIFIGTGEYHRIGEILQAGLKRKAEKSYVAKPKFLHSHLDQRIHTGPSFLGYLKVSEGCDRGCSFCIIPKIRGRLRSRTVASLITEAKQMAATGVKELSLVAQDLSEYGKDLRKNGAPEETLVNLLKGLCKIDKLRWIRLHYVYPEQFPKGITELLGSEKKLVKYLDIPLQHTSDRILKAMNRKLTKKRLFALIEQLRKSIPGIAIRTSIIVGFPGETEKDFLELCNDLEKLKLEHVGVFSFSSEEGTKAATLPGQIPTALKQKRLKILQQKLRKIARDKNRQLIGKTLPVIFEGKSIESDLLFQARMLTQAYEIDGSILINDIVSKKKLSPGDEAHCIISEAMDFDLVGKLI